ncbi:MAG: T9SS type A sorting domain-containing protein [Chlorobi bacterium]|nr:T9SS type A sorting domain-containing protein [Chlorobiota bacterium]
MYKRTIIVFLTIIVGLANVTAATHLDDNFNGYATTAGLQNKWDLSWKRTGVTTFSRTLNSSNGEGGSNAMEMYIDISPGTSPETGLGVKWEPCIYGITGYNTASGSQTDLTSYTGVRLWLKPGAVSGDTGVYFKLNLIEDEPYGTEEKWMSPKVYLSNLNPAGEYVYFDFNDFYQYYTTSNEAMQRNIIKVSYLFLACDSQTTQRTTATLWVDDITYIGGTPSLVRSPYLQNVTQSSVKVMWGSYEPAGKVFWGSTVGNYPNSTSSVAFKDNNGVYVHTATISGLTAGETVYYYVEDGSNGFTGIDNPDYHATSAPASGTPFRFVVYSDNQASWKGVTHHGQVISAMIPHAPDVILNCGDLAYDGLLPKFNDNFFSHAAPIQRNTAIYPAPGNHDVRVLAANRTDWNTDIKNWRDLFDLPKNTKNNTEDYYYFDYGDVRFIALNSVTTNYNNGNVYYDTTRNKLMKEWLGETLAATTQPWKIVYFHQQAFLDYVYDQGWDALFEQYGVQMVFFGHGHTYYPTHRNGVMYTMAGGGGGPLHEVTWWGFYDYYVPGAFREHHFVQVDISSDKLAVNVYNENGVLRHSYDLDTGGNLTNNVATPPQEEVDNFELYVDADDFLEDWGWYGGVNGGTLNRYFDTGGASGKSNVIRTEFSFSPGNTNPYGYAGLGGLWRWEGYTGLKLWVKGSQSGTGHNFEIRILEGGGQDKFKYSIPISSLSPTGGYIYPQFNDFVWYGDGGQPAANGKLDLDRIVSFFVGAGFTGTASGSGASTIYVDDITAVVNPPSKTSLDFAVPDKFALHQNYPNPFNQVTTIQYNTPKAANVQLIIYDILGREITSLVNSRLDAGIHNVQWDGRDKFGKKVFPGIYVYLIKAGGFTSSRKLLKCYK